MKVLIESVETGGCSCQGARRLNNRVGSPLRTDGGVVRYARCLARITNDSFSGRPYLLTTPNPWLVTFPGKVSASQPKLSPFAASGPASCRCGPRCGLPAERASQARPEGTDRASGQDPLLLFNSLRRSRFHTQG